MVDKAGVGQASESEKASAETEKEGALPPVHVPGPSIWPAVLGFGVTLLLFGVLSSWVFSLVGLVAFVWALASWITQIRHESTEHEMEHEPSGHETAGGSPHHDAHS